MKKITKAPAPPVDKKLEARAKKQYATFAAAFKMKRTWDRLTATEQAAWLLVAQVD